MTPPTASASAAAPVAATTKPTKPHNAHPEHAHTLAKVPAVEEPVLRELYDYRHSLNHLRKASHGAITLADVDAKANELALIMHRLRVIRENELEGVQRNRVDDVLDSIWMILFYVWGKIAAMDESLYPTYVNLVSITRTADALRASGEWTTQDVQPLQERLRDLEESVLAAEGNNSIRFLDPKAPPTVQEGDHVPRGQAILANLLNKAHRSIAFLNAENDTIVEHLKPVHHELTSLLAELDALAESRNYTLEKLAPLLDRLHAIDGARGPTGRFNAIPSVTNPPGHATCAGLLALCYDRLSELLSSLDTVPESSPLRPFERTLVEILDRLNALAADREARNNPNVLSKRLAAIQHDLSAVETRRDLDDGSFIPHGDSYSLSPSEAAILQGQARLHHLLRQCHALVSALVDPVCRPVSETLIGTYESLILIRARVRSLRREAVAGRNAETVRKGIDEVAAEIAKIEGTRVRGLFRGSAAVVAAAAVSAAEEEMRSGAEKASPVDVMEEDVLAWLNPQSKSPAVPEGQAAVSALLDECESLVWETRCLMEFKWG
ncbi:hypothetical protein HDU67_004974 [Dinochytrium kinnereticum]|nr:hypothetical protein HDU67_004974 [Dinochytrium kinnereticum]